MQKALSRKEYWHNMIEKMPFDMLAKDLHPSWDPVTRSYKTITDIYPEPLAMIKDRSICLEIGVGLGRNYSYLCRLFRTVHGYDLLPMIQRLADFKPEIKNMLGYSWEHIKNIKYDLIYECTCFQHMDLEEIDIALEFIKTAGNYFYTTSRHYNDVQGDSIFPILMAKPFLQLVWSDPHSESIKNMAAQEHFRALFKVTNG